MQLHAAVPTFSSVAARSCVKDVSRPTKMRSALMMSAAFPCDPLVAAAKIQTEIVPYKTEQNMTIERCIESGLVLR